MAGAVAGVCKVAVVCVGIGSVKHVCGVVVCAVHACSVVCAGAGVCGSVCSVQRVCGRGKPQKCLHTVTRRRSGEGEGRFTFSRRFSRLPLSRRPARHAHYHHGVAVARLQIHPGKKAGEVGLPDSYREMRLSPTHHCLPWRRRTDD